MFIRQWIIATIALFVLFGCQSEDKQSEQNLTDSTFEASIKTTDANGQEIIAFARGEVVNITVTVTNTSPETQTLEFGSPQQYDFAIKEQGGVEIWRLSAGLSSPAVISSYSLTPGESKEFTHQWDQKISAGKYIPAGQYTLEADSLGIGITLQQTLNITVSELSKEDFTVKLNTSDKFDQDASTFSQGEDINITVSVTNNSSETRILTGPMPFCDLVIKNQEGVIVWESNDGSVAYPAVMVDYPLEPGESMITTYKWDQKLSEEILAPVGEYTIGTDINALDITLQQSFSII